MHAEQKLLILINPLLVAEAPSTFSPKICNYRKITGHFERTALLSTLRLCVTFTEQKCFLTIKCIVLHYATLNGAPAQGGKFIIFAWFMFFIS